MKLKKLVETILEVDNDIKRQINNIDKQIQLLQNQKQQQIENINKTYSLKLQQLQKQKEKLLVQAGVKTQQQQTQQKLKPSINQDQNLTKKADKIISDIS